MIRQYASTGLQIVGLIVVGESLLLYFGQMGPMMYMAAAGMGLFYAGRMIGPDGTGGE
jgi:hypothetical protein